MVKEATWRFPQDQVCHELIPEPGKTLAPYQRDQHTKTRRFGFPSVGCFYGSLPPVCGLQAEAEHHLSRFRPAE